VDPAPDDQSIMKGGLPTKNMPDGVSWQGMGLATWDMATCLKRGVCGERELPMETC